MFGIKKLFGTKAEPEIVSTRRRTPVPYDNDATARVFSKELWDDPERADFLNKMGYTPDMPGNVIETVQDRQNMVRQSAMRGIQRQMALQAELVKQHGPVQLMPFVIIRDEIWQRDADGTWLQEMMEYDPYAEWNTLFIALDMDTSTKLNVPLYSAEHMGPVYASLDESIATFVRDLRATYGNCPDNEAREKIRFTVKDEIELMKPVITEVMWQLHKRDHPGPLH